MEDGEARGLDSRAAAAAGINRVHQGRWTQRVLRGVYVHVSVCVCACVLSLLLDSLLLSIYSP